ncbi:ATP-binding protein [Bacillus pacificus]|uniref:hybrid sensor histidine kinase/response regulator n=1 Tax=Bacillus pacificus TaxID=2026187 RepID=UPI003D1A9BB7
MPKRKILIVIFLFILCIVGFRSIWFKQSLYINQPYAEKGLLNLTDITFGEKNLVTLNGEWKFYSNVLFTPEQIKVNDKKYGYIDVPGNWGGHVDRTRKKEYGTYALSIKVKNPNENYSLKIQRAHNQFDIYVNGELIRSRGSVFKPDDINKTVLTPTIVKVKPNKEGIIDIVVPVTKYTQESKVGGITGGVRFGSENAVVQDSFYNLMMQIIAMTIVFLHGIYAFILFIMKPKNIDILYFSLGSIFAGITFLITDERLLFAWFEFDFSFYIKFLYVSFVGFGLFILLYIKRFVRGYGNNKCISLAIVLCEVYIAVVLFSSPRFVQDWGFLLFFTTIIPFCLTLTILFRVIESGKYNLFFLLFTVMSTTSGILWASFKEFLFMYSMDFAKIFDASFYPFDIVLAMLSFSTFWFLRFFRTNDEHGELVRRLKEEHHKKDQFLANTAHELRNPLHGMINIAQSVIDRERLIEAESKQHLKLLMTIGRRMSYLLNDLIDVTKIEQKGIAIHKEAVDLQLIITMVIDIQKFILEEKKIKIIVNIPESFPFVLADQNRLIQILFNLLHNAVKFTDEGTITIDVEKRNNNAIIRVKDTGIGIDKETQKRIFLLYEQGKDSYEESSGFGLGLSICKQLVEMHGGTLTVTSVLHEGTTFTFTLPIAENERIPVISKTKVEKIVELKQIEVKNNRVGKRVRILAVDDDPVNLKVLKSILPQDEYELETVMTGREALEHLNTGWDMVLVDVMMPKMSGYELTKMIREQYSISELPIMLLTARSQPEDIYTGFLAGANDYIIKPIDALELKVRINALTELKKSIHERVRMEGAWLQAQIQPHFLFNTLNTIAALGEIDIVRMEKLIVEFGTYLRASFGEEVLAESIPIQQELDLLQSYLYIEKERFGKRIQSVLEVEDGIECLVPPFSIQTLVENAARHGILKKAQGGSIHIKVESMSGCINILIADDGVGMTEEKIKEILIKKPNQKQGIGLLNTDARLKQLYGTGLEIKSELGKGTIVSFQVPLI